MNRWTGGGEKEQCKRRERELWMSIKMCPRVIYKKKKEEKVHLSPSQVFLLQFFLLISGMRVCVALESSLVPRERQTASDGGHGRFFLPGFEVQKLTFFFLLFFCLLENVKRTSLKLSDWDWQPWQASQPGSSYAWRKKKRKRNFPECLQIRI